MDESRIGQYSISVTTYPIMALVKLSKLINLKGQHQTQWNMIIQDQDFWIVWVMFYVVAVMF